MSEPITPDQEAIGLVEHARYIAECLYLEEIPDDADFNCRDIYDRLAPVADLIRTLAARNAELEKDRDEYMFDNGVYQAGLVARISELMEAARWRSCRDEPPEWGKWAVRNHGQEWFMAIKLEDGWFDAKGSSIPTPDEWRIIV